MIIKKYLVSTIEEVEALISRDLGPNAVILTSRQIKYKGLKSLFFSNKIEVVAAVEDNEMQNYNEFSENANVSPELSSKTQSGISREWESPIQTLVEDEKDPQSLKSGLEESAEYEPSNIPGTYLDPRFNRKQAFENIPLKPAPPKEPPEIDHLKKLSEALKAHFKTIPLAGKNLEKETVTPKLKELDHDLVSYLISCGISHSNGTLILENLISRQGPGFFQARELDEPVRSLLRKEISALLSTAGPICLVKGTMTKVAFLGLSGSGKTTALISIATQYLEEIERKVAVISHMPNKTGEEEQIRYLCSQLSLPLSISFNWEQLFEALQEHSKADLLLIDTPGFGLSQNSVMQQIYQDFRLIENLQTHLVISANTKDNDAINLAKNLSGFDLKNLTFTKLDETQSCGMLLNVSRETSLPIGYITLGPHIPTDLQVADPDMIAALIVKS